MTSSDDACNFELGYCSRMRFSFIIIFKLLAMTIGISLNTFPVAAAPIDTNFTLPSPLPAWPPGGEFAKGEIDLGGLKVRQITSFEKIYAANGGGPDDLGATFFDPSPIPDGFSLLGSFAHPNNRPLSGWVLVASDDSGDVLKPPINYTLLWPDNSSQNPPVFFWLPTPPDGYRPVGLLVTTSPDMPPLDRVRCVREDFTADAELDDWIWGQGRNVYGMRPRVRGTNVEPLSVGTFAIQSDQELGLPELSSCLQNKNLDSAGRLTQRQMVALFQTYAPYIYFNPEEEYLPSSVEWFFDKGALLYTKGQDWNPVRVERNGTNLPKGGWENGTYWLDLPVEEGAKEMVKKGDLATAEPYIHFKPVLGGTFTDIQVWLFYPFNGHATAKLGMIKRIPLGKMGQHVGDWEHVTLRISNFNGVLYKVYFSQHSAGVWVHASQLQFQSGNKFVGYASRNGHALNYQEGLFLQGPGDGVGLRNDWARSDKVMDTGARFLVVAAAAVAAEAERMAAPEWMNYSCKWGPTRNYDAESEVRNLKKFLIGKMKKMLDELVKILDQVFGMDGPTGPFTKANWNGDEYE